MIEHGVIALAVIGTGTCILGAGWVLAQVIIYFHRKKEGLI